MEEDYPTRRGSLRLLKRGLLSARWRFVGDELPGGKSTSYVLARRASPAVWYGMAGAAAVVSTVGLGALGTGASYCTLTALRFYWEGLGILGLGHEI